jgi:hypothetical protein
MVSATRICSSDGFLVGDVEGRRSLGRCPEMECTSEPNRTEACSQVNRQDGVKTRSAFLLEWRLQLAAAQISRGPQSLACLFLSPALVRVLPPLATSHLPPSALLPAQELRPLLLEHQNPPRFDRARYLPM